MHIAYIHQHFTTPDGSGGTRSYELGKRLVDAGHRVTMVCGWYERLGTDPVPKGEVRRSTIDGIEVARLGVTYTASMGFWQRVRSFGAFARAAKQAVLDAKPDLVFATSTPLTVGLPGMRAARRLDVPFVFEVRDLWPELPIAMGIVRNPALKWYLRRMERQIYRAATRLIGLAPGIADGIAATGVPADRITMIPNACDLELFRPSTDKDHPELLELTFTGAHGPANGLDAVVDVAAELDRRGADGVRLTIIGSGKKKPALVERTRALDLGHLVRWEDPLPKRELAARLPRMDVGMQLLADIPAFYRGTSPNKFFDYIAAGLPVLNNYPGWLADMIAERDCGKVVPPNDPAAFADAILWLRDHPDERAAMGQRARALAEERFDRDRLGARFVDWIEGAAS